MKQIFVLLTLTALALTGCVKYVPLEVAYEVKPVLNALMQRDSLLTVEVSLSIPPNHGVPTLRGDAVVKIYENGAFLETLTRRVDEGNPRYVGTHILKGGTHYRVTAEVPGYAMVEGEDVIPGEMGEFAADLEKRTANGADEYYIQLKLNDPAEQRNYYRVRLFAWQRYGNSNPWRNLVQLTYEGPELIDLFSGEDAIYEYVFDDAMFGGRIRQLPFKTRHWAQIVKYELEVSQISRDAYLYMQTLELQRLKKHEAFSESVTVHNNIRNGLGIVGGLAIGWKIFTP